MRGVIMIIQIETKVGMSEKVLDVLNGLKDVIIDKVEVKDQGFIDKKNELAAIHERALNQTSTLKNHEDTWSEIESLIK